MDGLTNRRIYDSPQGVGGTCLWGGYRSYHFFIHVFIDDLISHGTGLLRSLFILLEHGEGSSSGCLLNSYAIFTASYVGGVCLFRACDA